MWVFYGVPIAGRVYKAGLSWIDVGNEMASCCRGECGSGAEYLLASPDVKGDLEQWEALPEGTGNP